MRLRQSYLPATVAAIADAPVRLNFSKMAMRDLATELQDVPDEVLPHVMAAINGVGLMSTHWALHAAVRVRMWRTGCDRAAGWLGLFLTLKAKRGETAMLQMLHTMRARTVDHILRGKDREDQNSAGGFSKREAQALANMLATIRRYEGTSLRVMLAAACNRVHGGFVS